MSKIDMLNKECDNYLNRLQGAHNQINDLERQLELAKVNERDLNDIITALNDELSEKERQLEEAREEAKRERKERFWLWYAIGFCLDNKKIAEVREIFKEQLKEKGDE